MNSTTTSTGTAVPLAEFSSEIGSEVSTAFDPSQLQFEQALLADGIRESGLAEEFELSELDMQRLAANANAMVSLALCAADDAEFERLLQTFVMLEDVSQIGFMFGYCEHVRQQLLVELRFIGRAEEIRLTLGRRLEHARAQFLQAAACG